MRERTSALMKIRSVGNQQQSAKWLRHRGMRNLAMAARFFSVEEYFPRSRRNPTILGGLVHGKRNLRVRHMSGSHSPGTPAGISLRNLPRGVGVTAAVAAAVIGFALIFVFYSRHPSMTSTPPTADVLSARSLGIWMTEFSGNGDHQNSAYTGEKIDPTQIGFSLPFKFDQPLPWVRVFYNGKAVEGPLFDVGPGRTDNPFWNEKGGRPQIEESRNGAGIDATPAAWDAIGIGKGDPTRGKAKVDFELIRPPKLIVRQARSYDKRPAER
jgi:hypothetical protein